jgi:hypothetical protein
VSFAAATAWSSSVNVAIGATGPKTSSLSMRAPVGTPVRTVGG